MFAWHADCLQCFVFDKFEPHETEEDLVAASLMYIADQKLWAGNDLCSVL